MRSHAEDFKARHRKTKAVLCRKAWFPQLSISVFLPLLSVGLRSTRPVPTRPIDSRGVRMSQKFAIEAANAD